MTEATNVVALSGGKDSTALALRLAEVEPRDYTYVCTPTGDELPEMFAHWRKLGELLGKPIVPVMAQWPDKQTGKLTGGLKALTVREGTLPNFRMRFCTRKLKIEPYRKWLTEHTPCVSYVGLRADEEGRAGGAYGDIPGIEMRFPLREWGWDEAAVWDYLKARNVSIPDRTDCARCYHQRIGEWWALWHDHADIFADAEADEDRTGNTWRTPGRDSWPTALRDMRADFEAGAVPKGANQPDLFRRTGECRVCTL